MDQPQRNNWPSSTDRATRSSKEGWKKNQAVASSQRLEEPEPELSDEGDSGSQLRFPPDCWNVRGMFCISPDQFVKDNGFVMNNWVVLTKLAPESQVSEDGLKFKVKFVKKGCYKISLDEFEDLMAKGPYLIRTMKSNWGSVDEIVTATRESYNYDLQVDEPTPPLMTSPSHSNESGASSHSSGSTFKEKRPLNKSKTL